MAEFSTMSITMGNKSYICQDTKKKAYGNIWYQGNPLNVPYSLFLIEFSVISSFSLFFEFLLKPMGQPKIVPQILSGVIVGPSVLGHHGKFTDGLFPVEGLNLLKNIALSGVMFFLFLLGLKMDLAMMIRPGRKAMIIGFTLFLFSTTLPIGLSLWLTKPVLKGNSLFFVAASQHLTASPVIATLLNELKILNTNLGRLALSASMFADTFSIVMNMVAFSMNFVMNSDTVTMVGALLSPVAVMAIVVFIFRPTLMWMLKNSPNGKPNARCIFYAFVFVLVSGLLSEIAGQHYGLGPLVLGFVIPDGPPFGAALVSKLDTLITNFFFPMFVAILGIETDVFQVQFEAFWTVTIVVVFSAIVKILAVMLPGIYCEMPTQDALVLALILNAKGSIDLMMYSLWKDTKLLTEEYFALAVLSVMVVMAIITPLIKLLYDPESQYISNSRSTIQHCKRHSEFRILVCIHNQDSIPTIVNLLDASYAAKDSPVFVTAVLLVELEGRTAPRFFLNDGTSKTSTPTTGPIVNALSIYEEHNEGNAIVQSFTSISHIQTMYDQICQMASDKRTTIVIMPFHKQWAIDGGVEFVNPSIQTLNINVLEKAPCSVGILVDRGILSGSFSVLTRRSLFHVAAVFIGGPDDVESLSYAFRMARHESVHLAVIRFLQFGDENSKDRKHGSDLIDEYMRSNIGNKRFEYIEEVVKNGPNLSECLMALVDCYDLILVGSHHQESAMLVGLGAWSECPELGVIGDMLASPDFPTTASVLVVQQQRIRRKLMMHSVQAVVNNVEAVLHDVRVPQRSDSYSRLSISVEKN
ncbi:hypothetical protein Patl1_06703 [Pistacia atlantica]|uniref:Uncharacterized protein n=1 Tax=Pistacia atlantica TaxID=434234 RepID=A0ACC1BUJ5_9ROSI|nr:hypothetical protein Patl1_06703 [Pistacia atlantica]